MRTKFLRIEIVAVAALWLLSLVSSFAAGEVKTVRLLTVGNSFADNALTYLPKIVDAAGHKLIVARANLGGCTLERHWRHLAQHIADPEDEGGSPYGKGKYSLEDLLAKDRWDFITLQQVSMKSHDLDSYHPFARDLHRYIRERAPDSRIMAHQIWAYRVDDSRFAPKNEGKEPHTQEVMYRQVRAAYHQLADELGLEIVPSGDAMFLADRDPEWGYRPDSSFDFAAPTYPSRPKQTHSLHEGWFWRKAEDGTRSLKMDGHHASQAGKYLLGCVWFETFYGVSAEEISFVPKGIDADYAGFLRKTAHRAVAGLEKTR